MTFLWPDALWLLVASPVLVAAYFVLLRRRKVSPLAMSTLSVVREAGQQRAYRRHVPPLLLLLAVVILCVAVARPEAVIRVPGQGKTIVLAMDVSISMRATDVLPNRLLAAQRAAKAFVMRMPGPVRVGVVSFAGAAAIVQAPTLNREEVLQAIDRFQLGPATNLASAIGLSLAAMFPDGGIEVEQFTDPRAVRSARADTAVEDSPPGHAKPGSYPYGAIVLLTDGQRTVGKDPLSAAKMAADRGVKVYTVGIGTQEGAIVNFGEWSIHVRLDEDTLKRIAALTGAQYFNAQSAADLQTVYAGLSDRLTSERRETELTALFALAAALLVGAAIGLSIMWYGTVL